MILYFNCKIKINWLLCHNSMENYLEKFIKGLARKIVMLPPRYIQEENKGEERGYRKVFNSKFNERLSWELAFVLVIVVRQKNRYKRIEQAFWWVASSLKSYSSGGYIQHKCVVHSVGIWRVASSLNLSRAKYFLLIHVQLGTFGLAE